VPELEERQEPRIWGTVWMRRFLTIKAPLSVDCCFKLVTSFWVHCLTFQFSPHVFGVQLAVGEEHAVPAEGDRRRRRRGRGLGRSACV